MECKLWRNPQAPREVIAQILEYAALLRRWSFGDLTTAVRRRLGSAGTNLILGKAREKGPELEEEPFVDAVARSLSWVIFNSSSLATDTHAIAEHLNAQTAGLAQLPS